MLKRVGNVTTDSGLLYTHDPLSGKHDTSLREKVRHIAGGTAINGGFAIPTGGDVTVPVYRRMRSTGRLSDRILKRIVFDFTDELRNPQSNTRTAVYAGLALVVLCLIGRRA